MALTAQISHQFEGRHRAAQYRSHFDPNQPRVPAGRPAGGQWTREEGRGAADDRQVLSDATPDNDWVSGARYAAMGRRGPPIVRVGGRLMHLEPGQAARLAEAEARAADAVARVRMLDPGWQSLRSEPSTVEGLIAGHVAEAEQARARLRELETIEGAPIIPKQRPASPQERNDVIREVGRWLLRNREGVFDGASWLFEYEDSVRAYLDAPRTLEELRQAVANPKAGYNIHHIVEKNAAEKDGFPRRMIDHPNNLVRIPTFRHWDVTGWFMRENKQYDGLSPREYLRTKDWNERLDIGLKALIDHGVMKP